MNIQLSRYYRHLVIVACIIMAHSPFVAHAADDDVDALLARARAYLGGDAVLDAVKSLHFVGSVATSDGKTRQIEVMVRRPLQQRVIETVGDVRAITALDDYSGWQCIERPGQPRPDRVALLNAPEVRRLRTNTWQNLYYYRDIDTVGGRVAIAGDARVDGVSCRKAVFTHTGGITTERYFDQATGRLVMTKTDDGAETRESGVIEVAGVRFPKELTTTAPDGKSSNVVFDEIRVNEEFADALFEYPRPQFVFDQEAPLSSAPSAAPATP